jgi:hypothetical protein
VPSAHFCVADFSGGRPGFAAVAEGGLSATSCSALA